MPNRAVPNSSQAQGSSYTFAITYENAGQGKLAGGVATFGQVFAKGELPAGAGLIETINGASSAV
ncbi:hypothetical protein, partial [Roseomonas populi]